MEANQFNASGYWEPKSIVAFNDNIIAQFDRHWADPKPVSEGWCRSPVFDEYSTKARNLLEDEFGLSGSVVIKDPRFSRVLPIWQTALAARDAEPVFLIAYRTPMDVARSLAFRDKLSIEHGLRLWLGYMLDAEKYTRGQRRKVVQYDKLLADWRGALRPLSQGTTLPDLDTLNEELAAELDSFLDPTARHYKATQVGFDIEPKLARILEQASDLFAGFNENPNEQAFDYVAAQWRALLEADSPGNARSECVNSVPQVKMELSRQLEIEGRLSDAIALAQAAATLADDRAHYQFRLGGLYEKAGDPDAAIAALRRAIGLDDTQVRFHEGLARVLRKGQHLEAERLALEAAVALHGDQAALHNQLGTCYELEGALESAVSSMRAAVQFDRSIANFHVGLARVLGKLDRRDEAIDVLKAAVDLLPDKPQLHFQLGVLLEKERDLIAAAASMAQASKLKPDVERFQIGLARVLKKQGT